MEHLTDLGRDIRQIAGPTFKAYEPLLLKNADFIRSVPVQEFQYGPHARQQVDLYSPPNPAILNGRRPLLVFLYGGGLVRGDKTLQGYADDLVHANIAAFFALKHGYTVIVADYRLLSHGAKFPSGGEDVALVVDWILSNKDSKISAEPIDLFLMGNSAGGIHVSTFLLHKSFATTRARVLTESSVRLRGAILLSVPFDFDECHESRFEILNNYYDDYKSQCAFGLLKAAHQHEHSEHSLDILQAETRVFILNGELDPLDEILHPRDRFLAEWLKLGVDGVNALTVDLMAGHNHLSPCVSLSTGVEKEEVWGQKVAGFCNSIRTFPVREIRRSGAEIEASSSVCV